MTSNGEQVSSLNLILETGLNATKIALEASGVATSKMEALAEHYKSRAQTECTRAESEGLRAEDTRSRQLIAQDAVAKQVG